MKFECQVYRGIFVLKWPSLGSSAFPSTVFKFFNMARKLSVKQSLVRLPTLQPQYGWAKSAIFAKKSSTTHARSSQLACIGKLNGGLKLVTAFNYLLIESIIFSFVNYKMQYYKSSQLLKVNQNTFWTKPVCLNSKYLINNAIE